MLSTKRQTLAVLKVGGSLLEGGDDLRRAASAIAERRRAEGPLLVVASALQGVTDQLDLAARQALDRSQNGHLGETLDSLRRRHLELADGIPDGSALHGVREILDEAEALVRSIRAAGDLSDATYARLLCFGERLSVILLAAAIRAAGQEAQPIASEDAGLRAGGPTHAGSCDLAASAEGFRRIRRSLRDRVLVLTGFYGIGADGGVVLFGRGGSDNTACAAAAGLGADLLELWKDVPGLMSADPQEVRGARVVREITFDEADQLGAYGARIVNHGSLDPLRGRSTRVVISSIHGGGSGTLLVERRQGGAVRVVALAGQRGSPALIGAVGEGVAHDPGIRSRMLSCLSASGLRSDLVAQPSGHTGLSCGVHPDDLAPALSGLHERFFDQPERCAP